MRSASASEKAKNLSDGMESQPTTDPPQILIGLSSHYLGLRDYSAALNYALLARQSYPTRPEFPQIVAIASVLLAAEKRLTDGSPDWRSILQLETVPGNDTRPVIRTQFKSLALLVSPKNNRFPFAQDAFELVCDAWSVLSDPQKKTLYDNARQNGSGEAREWEKDVGGGRKSVRGTFWTLCPYCFYLYVYESVYEDCCLRCQNCRRAFHAVAVVAPPVGAVVEGKDQYYCGSGCFPLGFYLDRTSLGKKKGRSHGGGGNCYFGEKKEKDGVHVVQVSDDSDDDTGSVNKRRDKIGNCDGVSLEREVMKKLGEDVKCNVGIGGAVSGMPENGATELRNDGKRVTRRVKSVARNTKKLMGRGKKISLLELRESRKNTEMGGEDMHADFGDGVGRAEEGKGRGNEFNKSIEGNLEFFVGEDDIYIGLKDIVD